MERREIAQRRGTGCQDLLASRGEAQLGGITVVALQSWQPVGALTLGMVGEGPHLY